MNRETLLHILAVARGDEPADVLLTNARVVNVFTGEVLDADVAIAGETIAAVGTGYTGKTTLDLHGQSLVPGLIDSHVHVESSMTAPAQFARAIVPHGVTTVISDPHEIANVAGADGIRYMIEASEGLPLTIFINLPSCVPATSMGTAGATLNAADLLALRNLPRVLGLAEFMNVPGAVLGLPGALEKLLAFGDGHIDGHAPGVGGPWLQAYVAAGPSTDHESMTADEALEKARLGMYVLVREATAARNLHALLPAITPENARRFAFATDDRHPADLIEEGSVDHNLRLAIAAGLPPLTALRMATLNAAEAFGLKDRGAIAPGRRADLVVTPSLEDFCAVKVFAGGKLVAEDGQPVGEWPLPTADESRVRGSIHVDIDALSFRIPAEGTRIRAIGVIPDQIVTDERIFEARIMSTDLTDKTDSMPVKSAQSVEKEAVADIERDLLKLAVIERHSRTGRIGLGFVHGLGLKRGAIAGSVGHDCHNITVAGVSDAEMRAAVRAVKDLGGGLVAVLNGTVLASVPLPIAGLMSDQPVEVVRAQMDMLLERVKELGSPLHDPFMHLGFLALEVIPKLKLTDQGLVDVEKFDFVPLWV
ncbi:MAG TPA: adenine deaminase [Anaerolineae bacterium]|nr:adenine deaminase [Anaerolineae bacterium]HQK13072.1 adenine deaminase [Anaerolineae bacterium]